MSAPRLRRPWLAAVAAPLVLAAPLAAATPSSAASLGAAPTVAAAPAALKAPAARGSGHRWVVRPSHRGSAADPAFLARLRAAGAKVVAAQTAVGTVIVDADAATRARLAALPEVAAVAADVTAHPTSLGFSPSSQPGSMTNITRLTGAQDVWKAGYTGAGVDVALIDTGVAPVSGLNDPSKVFVGPDLSFESQSTDSRYLDSYGHGTNMAGIIAGRETGRNSGAAYAADTQNFYGMAPDARLVSIKVGDRSGAVDVSQMIAAIDWVIKFRNQNGLNIRVLNLSYGTLSTNDPTSDPLSWAAESAWKAGIAVVASGGNDGTAQKGLASPGFNPWIITVGASDTKGTDSLSDDTLAPFSQVGTLGKRGPDIVAPGTGIVSLGVPGSALQTTYGSAVVGNQFLRGSGTSQAAAVISGAVALLLQRYPSMQPDDLKMFLKNCAYPMTGYSVAEQGRGQLNLRTAFVKTPSSGYTQTLPAATGTGSLDKARGGNYVMIGGQPLTGEVDIMGQPWNATVAARIPGGEAWSWDGQFNGMPWLSSSGYTNDTSSWAGRTWSGRTWSGRTWSGQLWSGRTWSGGAWNGYGWSSASWRSPVATPSWSSVAWSSSAWR